MFLFVSLIAALMWPTDAWGGLQGGTRGMPLPWSLPAHVSLTSQLVLGALEGFLLAWVGYGLLNQRPAARLLMIAICAIALAFAGWYDIGWFRMNHTWPWTSLPVYVIYAWPIWYLSRPKVRAAFASASLDVKAQ